MYEGAIKMMAKQKVALDCLSYHASANVDDTEDLAKAAIPTADKFSLYRYVRLIEQMPGTTFMHSWFILCHFRIIGCH